MGRKRGKVWPREFEKDVAFYSKKCFNNRYHALPFCFKYVNMSVLYFASQPTIPGVRVGLAALSQ